MTFKSVIKAFLALCITAILWIAVCGCDDLGAYESTEEYCNSFGDIVLISGTSREEESYSVAEYFYNKESRESFLTGEDGAYQGVPYSDYVYMAIPLNSNIDMDAMALYLQSQSDVSVYINVFVSNKIPSDWKSISDLENNQENSGSEPDSSDPEDKDPDPKTRIGEIIVHLKEGKWGSFVLDSFQVDGTVQNSIQIKDGQYILLQIRNNSGVRVFDEEKQAYVDPGTGLELPKAEITMTNLLVRALEIENKE